MYITNTVTKKILENYIFQTFSNFGNLCSSKLLDSLKLLGFYYATNAGISISIEDLKVPNIKTNIINNTLEATNSLNTEWTKGIVSDIERFQSILNNWNNTTDTLKNKIIDYYKRFDPLNTLYLMTFSGARGNITQVKQLIGIRGLMSDQEGNLISLPIQTNFREGLSIIDYLISSYGARKGIVDTGLKTADSGYLTRRLIYVAQNLIIKEFDCKTKKGLIVLLKNKDINKNILGRYCLSINKISYPYLYYIKEEILIDLNLFSNLVNYIPCMIIIRSSLTCESNKSICQKCYGWDLSKQKLITLGEAIGILAAQSIGEPGTQLTMRTFHTGGIFTKEVLKYIFSPVSGKLILPTLIKKNIYRTNFGINILKLNSDTKIIIKNWKGIENNIFLKAGTSLYLKNFLYILKNQFVSQLSNFNTFSNIRKLRSLYTTFSGEIEFKKIKLYNHKNINFILQNGYLSIKAGLIYTLPKNIKYTLSTKLLKNKSFGYIKLMTPISGLFNIYKNFFIIIRKKRKININLLALNTKTNNYTKMIFLIVKNYQYIEKYSVLGYLYLFSNYNRTIYNLKIKNFQNCVKFFLKTNKDIFSCNLEQINDFLDFKLSTPNLLINNINIKNLNSGNLIYKNGAKLIFQNAINIFLNKGTILKIQQNNFINKNKNFALLIQYSQQNEDIVQGLPKIENLLEIPAVKNYCLLSKKSGIFLKSFNLLNNTFIAQKENGNFLTSLNYIKNKYNTNNLSLLLTNHSLNHNTIIYNNTFFEYFYISNLFKHVLILKKKKKNYILLLKNKLNKDIKKKYTKFKKYYTNKNILSKYSNSKLIIWKHLKNLKQYHKTNKLIIYKNKINHILIPYKENCYLYLIPLKSKKYFLNLFNFHFLFKEGEYIDLGEPITNGIIDLPTLLNVLIQYQLTLDNDLIGTIKALHKFQLILLNSIQGIYESQDISILIKHIEIIIRQITTKIIIINNGSTPFLLNEITNAESFIQIYKILLNSKNSYKNYKFYKLPEFKPIIEGLTKTALAKEGFLAAAGFQSVQSILLKASLEGKSDWLYGLKEAIIVNKYIPAGTTFLNYKNYLDNIYHFKY